MRLLLLASEFPPGPGGIGTHAYQLARQLQGFGWGVRVLTSQDYSDEEEIGVFNNSQPFEIVRWSSKQGLLRNAVDRWRVASKCVSEWKPDALLASGRRAVWLASLLAACHGAIPWVAVGHGTEFELGTPWEMMLTRRSFQRASCVVCVSEFTRQRMNAAGIRPRAEQVIPNGADEDQFFALSGDQVEQMRHKWKLKDANVLITVGNVTERKGQDVVIRALPHILRQAPNTEYLVVGLPTKQQEYQELARELGVAEHVKFMGRVDPHTLVELLNIADVFVMTSRHTNEGDFEGYGIAAIEAALCGKPSVVSGNSGLAEAVEGGRTGLIVPQNDPTATAQAIVSLLTDDSRREKMGQDARARALNEQTWETRAREYDKLLRGIATS